MFILLVDDVLLVVALKGMLFWLMFIVLPMHCIGQSNNSNATNLTASPTSDESGFNETFESSVLEETFDNSEFDDTVDSSEEPTAEPTINPTISPSDPTDSPTNEPTKMPTMQPSVSPTPPTLDPTAAPSASPSFSPTAMPLTLKELLKLRVDDEWYFDEISEYSCYVIILSGVLGVAVVYLIGRRKRKKAEKYYVEGQGYLSMILYATQIIDVLSDIFFFIQMNEYRKHGQVDDDVPDHKIFGILFIISFIFVIVPYILNISSSVRVVQRVTAGDSISEYTKKYFQRNAKLYSILTILSGGAFPALKVMNSNFMSLQILNAGLSTNQLERFRFYHLLSTLFTENLPQLGLQAFVMFYLKISSTIVVISFVSSVFNVLLNFLTAVVFIVLHQSVTESKFTISVSWSEMHQMKAAESGSELESDVQTLNPFLRTGRRVTLAKQLGQIKFPGSKSVHFEVMASKMMNDSCELYGVMQFDQQNESAATLLTNFMDKRVEILEAVITAFGYHPDFTDHYEFVVGISQSERSSRAEKAKMLSELLTRLGVDENQVQKTMADIKVETLCLFSTDCVLTHFVPNNRSKVRYGLSLPNWYVFTLFFVHFCF